LEVRDPIHGAIHLDPQEIAIADHVFVQRLRNIAQLGFSTLPFPGATHSRYAHSLGVMHLAGEAFDSAYDGWTFEAADARQRFRRIVRMAALCHDLGHAPYSHCTEFAMRGVVDLNSPYARHGDRNRRATHEDYTIAILGHPSMERVFLDNFSFTSRHVASLLSRDVRVPDNFFLDGGFDHRRLLSQLISSELDVDRLDYLVRDSTYSGAKYGQVDVGWLISNLTAYPKDGQLWLALDNRAIYAFEDFLIARHHMFLMVYFHHRSVVYEETLKRFVEDEGDWYLPVDLDEYLGVDDGYLYQSLRASTNRWAKRLTEHRVYRRVLERHGDPREVALKEEADLLASKGVDILQANCIGRLSRYNVDGIRSSRQSSLYAVEGVDVGRAGRVQKLTAATAVFSRYAEERHIGRLYVAPEDLEKARKILA
jgi:HD superfamily phosphohydrolase